MVPQVTAPFDRDKGGAKVSSEDETSLSREKVYKLNRTLKRSSGKYLGPLACDLHSFYFSFPLSTQDENGMNKSTEQKCHSSWNPKNWAVVYENPWRKQKRGNWASMPTTGSHQWVSADQGEERLVGVWDSGRGQEAIQVSKATGLHSTLGKEIHPLLQCIIKYDLFY